MKLAFYFAEKELEILFKYCLLIIRNAKIESDIEIIMMISLEINTDRIFFSL